MKITLLNNNKQTVKTTEIEKLVNLIRQGKYNELAEKFCNWLVYNRYTPLPKYLNRLPSFCLNEVNEQGALMQYNGLVHLYVRNLSFSQTAENLQELVNTSPRTFISYKGMSGSSVHFVCRYALVKEWEDDPELPMTEETIRLFHAHAYNDARKHYQKLLKQPIHFGEPKLIEWFRVPIDENLYYQPEAECVRLAQPLVMPNATPDYTEAKNDHPDPIRSLRPSYHRDRILADLFDNCFHETLLEHPRPGKEEDLHLFLSTLGHRCYQSGIPEADCVKWTLATLGVYAQESRVSKIITNVYGIAKGGFGLSPTLSKEQKLAWQLKDFLDRRYELRFNELKQCVEYVALHAMDTDFHSMDERVINDICFAAHEEGIPVWDKDVRRLVSSHYALSFNPLLDYVVSTPQWDGEDHIGNLARRVPTNHPHWPALFRRWFLSLVAHWIGMDREHANSVTPQLLGGPGKRKSTFCRMILPLELRDYYTDHLNLSSLKSATRMLSRFALINIDEFDQIPASRQAFLKNFLQMPDVKDNAPYRSEVKTFRRYASFIATSNMQDVLTDPSGSRRYLCVEVTGQIDTSPVDYPQLYAQAYRLLRSGEQYWFTQEEESIIRQENTRFEHEPGEDQLFRGLFRAAAPDEECEEIRAAELLMEVERHYGVKFGKKVRDNFCRRLSRMGVPCVHRYNGNFYQVVRIMQS